MDGLLIKVTLILKVNLLFELLKPVISYLYLLEFKVTKFYGGFYEDRLE